MCKPHALRRAAEQLARSARAPASAGGSQPSAPPPAARCPPSAWEPLALRFQAWDGQGQQIGEAALEALGASGQERAWPGGDKVLSVADATVGWSPFAGTAHTRTAPAPEPPRESRSSCRPADAWPPWACPLAICLLPAGLRAPPLATAEF